MKPFLIVVAALISSAAWCADNVVREVQHELVLVKGRTAFDWITFKVDGGKVTLMGEVVHADLKRDAEKAVKGISGVSSVENDLEVLPDNAEDERIRRGVLQAIDQQMFVYLSEEVKSIHIVVKNGKVTLEGQVQSQADKDKITALAQHVQRVTGVTNNLVITK